MDNFLAPPCLSFLIKYFELTEVIKDYLARQLLSSFELDFLEGELWEPTQHIAKLNTFTKTPKIICKKLDINEKLVGNYIVLLYFTL